MTLTEDRPSTSETTGSGRVVRVTGPVVDVEFPGTRCPSCSTPSRSTSPSPTWARR
ncbi:hypothetical protein [Klenkia terrae]